MWGALISGLGYVLNWLLGASTVKWAVLAVLWYGITVLVDFAVTLLPSWFSADGVGGMFGFFNSGMWYFFDYFQGPLAVSVLFGAAGARFLIRRIPFIG